MNRSIKNLILPIVVVVYLLIGFQAFGYTKTVTVSISTDHADPIYKTTVTGVDSYGDPIYESVIVDYHRYTTTSHHDVQVEIPGASPTTEAGKKAEKDAVEKAVLAKLNEIATEIDKSLLGTKDLLAQSDVRTATAVREQINVNIVVNVRSEKLNAALSKDPVRFATGRLVTQDADLSLSVDSLVLEAGRQNINLESFSGQFGGSWSSSFDSRVIWGRMPLAKEYFDDLTQKSDALWSKFHSADQELNAYAVELDQQESSNSAELVGLRQDMTSRVTARDSASYSEVSAAIQETIDSLQAVIASYESLLSRIRSNRTAIHSQFDSTLANLKSSIETLDAELEQAKIQKTRAAEQTSRDGLVWHPGDPTTWIDLGSDKLLLIDDAGTGHLLTLDEGVWDPNRRYADGTLNWHPSGSDATGLEGRGESFRLNPSGGFVWTKKSGEQWIYSLHGQLTKRVDPHGNFLKYDYSQGLLDRVVDKRGRVLVTLFRDSHDRLSRMVDLIGRSVSYGYDGAGRLGSVTNVSGDLIQYQYDSSDRLTKIVKPDQSSRNYRYETASAKVEGNSDEEDQWEGFVYGTDSLGRNYTLYTDPTGVWEKHFYDGKFRDTRVENANGASVEYLYDGFDRVSRETWNSGLYRTFTYDGNGNLIQRRQADGTSESWTYTALNVLDSYTDARGYRTRYTSVGYDVTRVDHPDGSTERFGYSPSDGKIVSAINAKGGERQFAYDTAGYLSLIAQVSPSGTSTQQFTNDPLGRVLSTIDQAGACTFDRYALDGQVAVHVFADGRALVNTFNNRTDKIKEEIRRYGDLTSTQVVSLSVSDFEDPARYQVLAQTIFGYDKRHLLTQVTNALGQQVRYAYDGAQRMVSKDVYDETGGLFSSTAYQYQMGQLTKTTLTGVGLSDPLVKLFQYDAAGRLVLERDARGIWTRSSFDSLTGQLTAKSILLDGTPESGNWKTLTTLEWRDGKVKASEDWQGLKLGFDYDSKGRVVRTQRQVGGAPTPLEEVAYDPTGALSSRLEAGMKRTEWDYDVWGNQVAERNALALSQGRNASQRAEYDGRGLVSQIINDAGLITNFRWDELGRLVETTQKDSLGYVLAKTTRTYSYEGGLLKVVETDPRGVSRSQTMDALGRVVVQADGYGKSKTYRYNVQGQVIGLTDAVGVVTAYTYDAAGRMLTSRVSGVLKASNTYDGAGNMLSSTDGENRTTTYAYDVFGRMTQQRTGVTPAGAALTTNFTFSDDGRTVTRQTGNFVHTYVYDDLKRLVEERNAGGAAQKNQYDALGNLVTRTNYNGKVQSYDYDALNRLLSVRSGSSILKSFSYDALSHLVKAENSDTSLTMDWDLMGRMTGYHDSKLAEDVNFGYDASGNRTGISWMGTKRSIKYAWGNNNELKTVTDSLGGVSQFSYDDATREVARRMPSGLTQTTGYDEQGQVSFLKRTFPEAAWANNAMYSEAYVYNNAGQKTLKIDSESSITAFHYDDAGRLDQVLYPFASGKKNSDREELDSLGLEHRGAGSPLGLALGNTDEQRLASVYANINVNGTRPLNRNQQSWKESFAFDPAGNIATKTTAWNSIGFVYNSDNQLTKAGEKTLGYDANGNLTSESLGNKGSVYQYNLDNRLIDSWSEIPVVGVAEHGHDKNGVKTTYDALGRRSSRIAYDTKDDDRDSSQAYLYDGLSLDILGEFTNPNIKLPRGQSVAYKNNSYVPVMENTLAYGQAIERTTYQDIRWTRDLPVKQQVQYQVFDTLGSLSQVSGEWRNSLQTYKYDAYGSAYQGAFYNFQTMGYNGKRIETQTGNYDYGYRNYSPTQARFTTVDPIQDGSNWYGYVGNDPVNFTDPYGLSSSDISLKQLVNKYLADPFERMGRGFAAGARGSGERTINGIRDAVEDPVGTTKRLSSAVAGALTDPVGTGKAFIDSTVEKGKAIASAVNSGDFYLASALVGAAVVEYETGKALPGPSEVKGAMLKLPASMAKELPAYEKAALEGALVRTQSSVLPKSTARANWEATNGPIPQGFDVDHIIQRQFGGGEELENLQLKTSSLNRSEGGSAYQQNKSNPYGTVFTGVELLP